MRTGGALLILLATVVSLVYAGETSQDCDPSLYVGVKACRMCHKKEDTGNQYGIWLEGPHAKAVEALGTEKAKTVASGLGIEDPQKSGKCLKCHSTAYNWTEEAKTDRIAVEEGVSCESCHGPGKNYKAKTVMEDREKSIAGGMVYPATKSCARCHNDSSPTWKPDRYTLKDGTKTGFDAEQAYEKIKHPNPELHEKPEEVKTSPEKTEE